MMLEPSAVVLYVNNLAISSQFYQDLLGIKPEAASPTFHGFTLSNGMSIGLKANPTVTLAADNNVSGELAFTLEDHTQVDALFAQWQKKGITMSIPPTILPFGYTFLALDPDGNRLRVVSLAKGQG